VRVSRFARDAARCSIGLGSNARSRAGVDFTTAFLKIVDERGTRSDDYPSHDAALRAYHDEVGRRLAAGWRLTIDDVPIEPVRDQPDYATLRELEAAVLAEPDNETAWSVLGDAWAQAGDPRGECILLSRGTALSDPAEFMRRKAGMLPMIRQRTSLFFGPFGDDAYRVSAKFSGGLVDAVELADEDLAPGRPTSILLEQILTSPFACFLSVLSFRATTVAASLEVLATVGAEALRALVIRQLDERSPVPVRLGPASSKLGRLRKLALQLEHAPIDWADTSFPSLTQLELAEPGSPTQCDELLAWISGHPTLAKIVIGPGLSSSHSGQIMRRLDAWVADSGRWPGSLREVSWNHRITRR
jgi:hypothetical protein